MYRKLILVTLFFAFTGAAIAQDIEPQAPPKSDDAKQLEANAVDLLKETSIDVNNLRTLPNRIGFSAELASLMWYYDERQAKAMFGGVISDYRELIARYNADLNAPAAAPGTEDDPSDKSIAERRMRTAITVGQQITTSIAEHDPELAFSFYFDSLSAISSPELRKQVETQGGYFEMQLLIKIAQKDPAKALPYAKRSLARGFGYQHIELLRNLYAKDADAAAGLGETIAGSVKTNKIDPNNFWAISNLISFGTETLAESKKPGGKRAVFSESQLRDISEAFADGVLNLKKEDGQAAGEYANQIERYSPGRAAQVRAKFGITKSAASPRKDIPTIAGADVDEDATPLPTKNEDIQQVQAAKRAEDREKQMYADVASKMTKELPADERARIVAEARRIIAETPGREKKIGALCFLAGQVRQAGDKELAASLLKDAASFVNPEPKNYKDFLLTWVLVSGYAAADPEQAFSLLADTIGRANDTINAFIKVGEFIDTDGEIVVDGEVQVGSFGGNMVRGITGELGLADATILMLARADFAKTRDLTNKFDRPEVRVLAKMLVIRAILGTKLEPGVRIQNSGN